MSRGQRRLDAALLNELAPITQLPPQLWVDVHGVRGTPSAPRFQAPADDHALRPHRGLWTSTWRPDTQDSAFLADIRAQLADDRDGQVRRPAWLLTPRPVRVWEIVDAMAQLDLILLAAGQPIWPQVAGHVDAVHMTDDGARAYLRAPLDDGRPVLHRARQRAAAAITDAGSGMPLDWWYTESTYWCRWKFSAVERIDDVDVPAALT